MASNKKREGLGDVSVDFHSCKTKCKEEKFLKYHPQNSLFIKKARIGTKWYTIGTVHKLYIPCHTLSMVIIKI